MGIFRNRPLAVISCAFVLGCAVGATTGTAVRVVLLAVCLALSLPCALLSRRRAKPFRILYAAFASLFIAFSASHIFFDVSLAGYERYYGENKAVRLTVDERLTSGTASTVYGVRIEQIDGENSNVKALLQCEYVSNLQPGYVCEMPVNISGFASDGIYDGRSTTADGYRALAVSVSDAEVKFLNSSAERSAQRIISDFGKTCSGILHGAVGGDEGAIASALVLGDRDYIDGRVSLSFTRAGGTHLLALSGMHVGVILGILGFILIKLRIARTLRSVILGLLALAYLALTGCAPSAVRAVIMALSVYCAWCFRQASDAFTSVSFAAALMLLLAPSTVLSYGFWLSVAATAGIIVFAGAAQRMTERFTVKTRLFGIPGKIFKYVMNSLAVSAIALGSVMMLNAFWFGSVSYASPLTSLVLSLPTAGVLISGIFTLIFCKIPFISGVFAFLCRICSKFMLIFTSDVSDIDGVLLPLDYTPVYVVCVIAAALICAAAVFKFKRRIIPVAAVISSVAAVFIAANIAVASDGLTAEYACTSCASRQIVLSKGGSAVICDASQGSAGQLYATLDGLEHVTEIRAVLLTDYQSRHPEMLSKLAGRVKLREIWVPEPSDAEEYYILQAVYTAAGQNGAEVFTYSDGRRLSAFGGELTVKRADAEYSARKAVAVDFEYGNGGFTYLTPVEEFCSGVIDKRDFVIFSADGPKISCEYSITVPEGADLIFESQDVLAYSNSEALGNCGGCILLSPERYKTRIGR